MSGIQTIKQARDYIASNRNEGVYCPCCSKFVKAYRRKINATQAAALIWLVRMTEIAGRSFAHVPSEAPRTVVRSNQLSTLKHWGLVENVPGITGDDGNTTESGAWKPTQLGIDFVYKNATVPSHVVIADDQTLNPDAGPQVNVITVLGNKFNYDTLINFQG